MSRLEVERELKNYAKVYGQSPNFVRCLVQWNEDQALQIVTIALSKFDANNPKNDDKIFFYADGPEDFLRLLERNNGEDFVVAKIYWFSLLIPTNI